MTFPFPFLSVGGAGPLQYEFADSAVSGATSASYTFPNVSLGANDYSHVLVGFVARSGGTPTISGVTVAGAAADEVFTDRRSLSSNQQTAAFYIAPRVAALGDIVVTGTSSFVRSGISVWALRDHKSPLPYDGVAGGGTAATNSVTPSTVKDGAAFAIGYTFKSGGQNEMLAGSAGTNGDPVLISITRGNPPSLSGIPEDVNRLIASSSGSSYFTHIAAIALR